MESFTDPVKAVSTCVKKPFNLIVTEYELDSMNGLQMIGILQGVIPTLRSIMLTNCNDEIVEIQSIECGVDQFLSKQKSLDVIVTYIENALARDLREQAMLSNSVMSEEEGLVIDTKKREVYKNDQIVDVTKKEYDLLHLFLNNKGVALSRETIAEELWTTEIETIDLRVIDGHINRLRTKLDLYCINAIRGFGYKWNEQ
ncbi:DNA-binding response OmpR family regulator [Breznakia sp. PH1-1]|nr:DNA-binding response OmpR family regulator [Breznakia sp. PH1-1]MDH6404611.1 DNA-binding response OmpR family regulator [Breznakia sp. PF1-11]MDH6412320.1 DNA-binding response OmpR family regulator [Breznakia sp. PFB1-11]MDH6414658.1 DNA-binding response OmpR family regulator [Breznakia sp. PFB1-14]MDH6416947.1 DNA-binding response OmpR family regulator [Breznakia sp. PFB1-4]MDH6419353.1 DNA-binding response OmpR family regulator [Breznakia sp. PFB1-12]MDH6474279.1 DNA-binding response Omp